MNRFNFKLSRRSFIKLSGAVGLASLVNPGISQVFGANNSHSSHRLVFLEMNGGNDGLNTVIPYGQGAYYDLRPKLAIPPETVLHLNNQLGLHPALVQLQKRFQQGQVAIVQGVGHPQPDLSHFAMMDYWRAGHLNGMVATEQTGWLGRILDSIKQSENTLSGLSLYNGIGPVLASKSAIVAALMDTELPYIPDQYQASFWSLLDGLGAANASDSVLQTATKKGMRNSRLALDLLPQINALSSPTYPKTETGRLLDMAARILAISSDIRVLHIPLPMEFDTHSDQAKQQTANFTELDAALEIFFTDLANKNLVNQTSIVIVSEFGRRVAENNSLGTDHGTANNVFVIGSNVNGGIYGQQPSLTDLDADGNLKMSLSYLDFLASVAEDWLGVGAAQIVLGSKLTGLFL